MSSTLKDKLTDDKKILILFLILFVFNVAFFVNLFDHMIDIKQINISVLNDFITINSAIIILGFTSTRLPKLKKSDAPIYEIGYFIIIGLLSITVSYFNEFANGKSLWAPFIEMFKILSVLLIFTYIATKTKSFKAIARGDHSRKAITWQIIICSILGILASYLTMDINGIPANSRAMIVMISGLLGGPYVGIPVGIISGLWRFSMGGSTAFACFVGTAMAGIVGSLVHKWNGNEFLIPYKAGLLMFLYSGFDMFLITILTPQPEGIIIANTLYAPMTFAAVFGMILFTLFLDEKKEETETKDDSNTDKILEMSQKLEEYKAKADETERELKEHKDKVEELKNEIDEIRKNL